MLQFIRVDGDDLDFAKIEPCSDKPADMYSFSLDVNIHDQNGNLDWCIKNWGTSSNAINTSVENARKNGHKKCPDPVD